MDSQMGFITINSSPHQTSQANLQIYKSDFRPFFGVDSIPFFLTDGWVESTKSKNSRKKHGVK